MVNVVQDGDSLLREERKKKKGECISWEYKKRVREKESKYVDRRYVAFSSHMGAYMKRKRKKKKHQRSIYIKYYVCKANKKACLLYNNRLPFLQLS